jgi:hypothetical protein
MTDGPDEQGLARDMIEIHGAEAAAVARGNARAAALAGQPESAKFWIRVLGIIQRRQADTISPPPAGRENSGRMTTMGNSAHSDAGEEEAINLTTPMPRGGAICERRVTPRGKPPRPGEPRPPLTINLG